MPCARRPGELARQLRRGLAARIASPMTITEIFNWAVELCGQLLCADVAEAHLVDQRLWSIKQPEDLAARATAERPQDNRPGEQHERHIGAPDEGDDGRARGVPMLVAPVRIGDYAPDAYIVLARPVDGQPFTEDDAEALTRAAEIIGEAINSRLSAILPDERSAAAHPVASAAEQPGEQ